MTTRNAAAVVSIVFTFLSRGSPLVAADWLHFGHDSQYTSSNPAETTINSANISRLQRRWGLGCDDGFFSVISRSPAIYNGTLYTSGAGSRLTAYNASTGEMLWHFGQGNAGWAPQPVVSQDGIVFYLEGSIPTNLYAVDSTTGQQLWQAPIDFALGFNDTAVVTVDEARGVVYVIEPGYGGRAALFALDKHTGEVVWYMSKAKDDVAFEGDHVLVKGGKVFAAAEVLDQDTYPTYRDHILKIDAASQNIDTKFDRPQPEDYYAILQSGLCNDRLLVHYDYDVNPARLVVAYNVASPAISWQKALGQMTGAFACDEAKNRIYVPTDPYLYALDAATGAEIWKYTGYGAIYSPSVANGIVYFLSDTSMYALDENTGQRVFRYPLGYEAYETTQVAVADGMLYFSGNGGTCDLYALALGPPVSPTPTPMPTVPLPTPTPGPPAAAWLHFGHDGAFTSDDPTEHTITTTNVTQLVRMWGIGCDNEPGFGQVSLSPAIREGTLYAAGTFSKLTAFDARTGERVWQFEPGSGPYVPGVAVSEDGIVFYLEDSIPTYLHAVDGRTGRELWQAPFGFDLGFNDSALVTVDEANGVLYIVEPGYGGRAALFALDKHTGEVVWYKSPAKDGIDFEADYVLLDGGKIFAGTLQGMVKIDAASQNIETTFPGGNPSRYTLCNGRLVAGYDDFYGPSATVIAYDPVSATSAWQKAVPHSPTTGAFACNPARNRIYVPTDPYLYALDASTGAELWRYTGFGAIYSPSVANGIVYFLSGSNLYAIDESTGTQLFSYRLGADAHEGSQVVVNDGTIYFSAAGGTCDLYALSVGVPGTSTPTRTATPSPTPSPRPPTPTHTLAATGTPTPRACPGDCDGNGEVTIDELLAMVNIALGTAPMASCEVGDVNRDQAVTIDEILTAVHNALNGCR
jgi:outer membrane protein assembly factor BamB